MVPRARELLLLLLPRLAAAGAACSNAGGSYDRAAESVAQGADSCSVVATSTTQPWSPAHGSVKGNVLTVNFPGGGGPLTANVQQNGDLEWSNGQTWARDAGPAPPSPPAPAPGACHVRPGKPPAYKQLCESEKTQAACEVIKETCVWIAPPPAPPKPPPGRPCGPHPGCCSLKKGQPAGYRPLCANASRSEKACEVIARTCAWTPATPSGRPCAPKYSPTDMTGLWTLPGAANSKAMLWAQQVGPSSCFAGACTGTSYLVTCVTGNYSAAEAFTFGTGCPFDAMHCQIDAEEMVDQGHHVTCGGAIALMSADGTELVASPSYPDPGIDGWRRVTGKMTGLWSAVNDNETKTEDVYVVAHDWTTGSVGVYWFPASSDAKDWQWGSGSRRRDCHLMAPLCLC